jgi:Transposase DNA-binding/Transposase DDE domain
LGRDGNVPLPWAVQVGMHEMARSWAENEFGAARLGDRRREKRLVDIAAAAAARPGGTITGTFQTCASREAAFRFVENEGVSAEAIASAVYTAAARRSSRERVIAVPVDQTSLSLPDRDGRYGFGPIGNHSYIATGIHVMNALAVSRDGATIGLLDQQWWVRGKRKIHRRDRSSKSDRRPFSQRESFFWVRALKAASARLSEHAPSCTPWFQLDRGADCTSVLSLVTDEKLLVTVRAKVDRRLVFGDGRRDYLMAAIRRQPIAGHYHTDVPERPGQSQRRARLAIRFLKAPVALPVTRKRRRLAWLNVVAAEEVEAPEGQEPLRWVLLTTRRVMSFVDALQVVACYCLRWRLEDFHKAWKSGACDIEASRLRARSHLQRWATIMAAVAARIERLKHMARHEPTRSASDEFSQDEIDATILLRRGATELPYEVGDVPTIAEITRWIADLGGYMGSRNSRPPGTVVIRRGLELVAGAAAALRALRAPPPRRSGQS